MTEPSLSQLTRVRRSLAVIAADPWWLYDRVARELRERPDRHQPVRPYAAADNWDALLHAHFGSSMPCEAAAEFAPLWERVLDEMTGKGVKTGPMSYFTWNDGDRGLVRAAWCLVRHLKAAKVVETGVAHGVTSRFVLEALRRNGRGHLWSIDLPPMIHAEMRHEIGAAVSAELRENWTYVSGSSRRRLPGVLRETSPIDLFIHDSNHSKENTLFELRQAWPAVRPGGAILVDDIDASNAFHEFCATVTCHRAWACEAEPIRPDERRTNRKGFFGIIIKAP